MSEREWRNKILGLSNGEIIDDILRNPIACDEAKQVARDELLFRLIGDISIIKDKIINNEKNIKNDILPK